MLTLWNVPSSSTSVHKQTEPGAIFILILNSVWYAGRSALNEVRAWMSGSFCARLHTHVTSANYDETQQSDGVQLAITFEIQTIRAMAEECRMRCDTQRVRPSDRFVYNGAVAHEAVDEFFRAD